MRRVLTILFLCVAGVITATAQEDAWEEIRRQEEEKERRREELLRKEKEKERVYEAAESAAGKERWEEAFDFAAQYVALCDTSTKTFCYARMIDFLAMQADRNKDYETAITLGERVISIRREARDCEKRHVATALSQTALYHSRLGHYDIAINMGEEAVEIFSRHAYKHDSQYAVAMANLASFLCSRANEGDYQRAVQLSEQSLKQLKKGTVAYLTALNNLAVCYSLTNRLSDAQKAGNEVFKLGRKIYKDNLRVYTLMLSNHVMRLADVRAYSQAMSYAEEARKCFVTIGDSATLAYAKFLVNCGVIYTACDKYEESEQLLTEADGIFARLVPHDHPDYMRCLTELIEVHNKRGERDKVDVCEQRLRKAMKGAEGGDGRSASLAEKLADTMAGKGNYGQAIMIVQSAIDIYRTLGRKDDQAYALNKLADYYIATDSFHLAADSAKYALQLLEGVEDVRRNDVLNTLAMAYYYQGKTDTARVHAEEAVKQYRAAGDTLTAQYTKTLSNLALYTYVCADTTKAITIAEEAMERQISNIGEMHPDNVATYYNLVRYHGERNDDKAREYYHRALDLQTTIVRNNFSYLTSAEREAFWNMKSYVYKAAPTLAYLHQQDDSLLVDAYNAQLFTKGLLLNSEINFVNFLKQAGDSVLLAKYERFELLRRDMDATYAMSAEVREERMETLRKEADELERQLVRECKQFGDFMSNLSTDCRAVSEALSADEVAVELMNLYLEGVGDTYLALYLKKGWKAPRCRILFSQAQMDDIGWTTERLSGLFNKPAAIDSLYRDEKFGRMVWGPLLDELKEVKTMYFAPAGMFYQLGAEYLAIDSARIMADIMDCHRLSSTRLVTQRKAKSDTYRTAAVFGGFNYDMGEGELLAERDRVQYLMTTTAEEDEDDFDELALAADSMSFRALSRIDRVRYLPGTLEEAEMIGETLMQNSVMTDMYVGRSGLEERFKSLDGQQRNIIHIATHGFALSEEDEYHHSTFNLFLNEDLKGNPLSRSGLLFAGANHSLSGGHIPEGMENGVLTAREISLLDLAGASLVVMSACRTGMGEVRDDGVFGLQRGFKKAGAQTLLMSLWNVEDHATEVLMETFYTGIMQGMTKFEALKNARQVMRTTPSLNRPAYWGAFIMLDDF